MPGFSSRADLITEAVAGKIDRFDFNKIGLSGTTIGVWQSQWTSSFLPGAGATPATTPGTVYTSDQSSFVTGGMWFPDRSTDKRFLVSLGAVSNSDPGTLMVYDRLAAVSGISLASTGSKTINTGALDRYTGTAAIANEVWLEITTATTTTAPTVNLNSYTSADGSTGVTGGSVTFPQVATPITSMIQLPMDASKQGVRSVEAGLNVGTASATGVCNVVILRPIARIPTGPTGRFNEVNFLDDILMLPQIFDNATLAFAYLPSLAAQNGFLGSIVCVYG